MSKRKVTAYCKACGGMIDITDMPFIGCADETPIVLDMQLTQPVSGRKAINFVKRTGIFDFSDYGYGKEKMNHYESVHNMSHMEVGDDTHILDIKGGYWSVE